MNVIKVPLNLTDSVILQQLDFVNGQSFSTIFLSVQVQVRLSHRSIQGADFVSFKFFSVLYVKVFVASFSSLARIEAIVFTKRMRRSNLVQKLKRLSLGHWRLSS